MKATEIVLIISTAGGVIWGSIERLEKYEAAKSHNRAVAEIATAAQASGEAVR